MNDDPGRLLAELRALEAVRGPDGGSRFLFRGGAARHDRLAPPLARLADEDEELARAAHAVCRRCKDVVCRFFELAHDPLEALAVLACHGWPTPFVHLTASADVALLFARERGCTEGVITVVDRAALPERVAACSSEFLALARGDAAPGRAWVRQRATALIDAEWRRFDTSADFDLTAPDCAPALSWREARFEGLDLPAGDGLLRVDDEAVRAALREAISVVGRKVLGPSGEPALGELLARW